jgi:hypothetical protein
MREASEADVGIGVFIGGASAPFFHARIKQTPDDFRVTEVDSSGRLVALDSSDVCAPPDEVPRRMRTTAKMLSSSPNRLSNTLSAAV